MCAEVVWEGVRWGKEGRYGRGHKRDKGDGKVKIKIEGKFIPPVTHSSAPTVESVHHLAP